MALLTLDQLRAVVPTSLDDARLQEILDDEETELIRRCGAHGNGVATVVESIPAMGGQLFLSRPAASITSIVSSGTTLASSTYTLYPGSTVTAISGAWPTGLLVVTYVPADDRAQRRRVLAELVRLTLERTAMQSESVAGEYSYQAPNWEAARASLYRRLTYMSL